MNANSVIKPARLQSQGLWSLWEMLEKHALLFADAISILTEAKWSSAYNENPINAETLSKLHIAMMVEGCIKVTREACILSDMDNIIPEIDRLEQSLSYFMTGNFKLENITQQIKHLISRIKDDLGSEYYFHLSPKDVSLFYGYEPFGSKVSKKFPKATEDIAEASKCLSLQRPTASVFHLMRVMELALRYFAKMLKVTSIDPNVESWNKITDHANKAISQFPAKTAADQARKAKYGAVLAHLNSVRIAWRNEVMHPKQTYTREEAHAIFNAVHAFMADLAVLR